MTAPDDGALTTTKRSPSYPATPLDVAVERAQILYDRERRHPAPIGAIQAHWGYKAGTGPASLAIAALKKYGLIADSGSGNQRTAQITQLAYDILHHPDRTHREQAIQKAALNPPIHKELWEQYMHDGLPSDRTLRYELITNRAFTERGATEFISQFRKTVAFANLADATNVDPDNPDPDDEEEEGRGDGDKQQKDTLRERRRKRHEEAGMLSIPVPIVGGKPVTIEGQFPISEAAWTQFIAVLNAMKPGLVADDEDA